MARRCLGGELQATRLPAGDQSITCQQGERTVKRRLTSDSQSMKDRSRDYFFPLSLFPSSSFFSFRESEKGERAGEVSGVVLGMGL